MCNRIKYTDEKKCIDHIILLGIADDLIDKEAKAKIKELEKLCHSIIKTS